MKRFSLFFILLAVISLITISGCSQRLGSFTILSTRNVEMSAERSLVERDVRGRDGIAWFLFIPIGSPSLSDAVDKILAKNDADFLTNVVIHYDFWTIIIFSYEGYKLTADAWRNGAAPSNGSLLPRDAVRPGREYELLPTSESLAYRVIERR